MEALLHNTLNFLIYPTNLIFFLICGGLILLFFKRKTLGRIATSLGVGYFALVGMSPLGPYTLSFLENRFPVPKTLPQDAKGFIILGGSFDTPLSQKRMSTSYTSAGGRFFEALRVVAQAPTLPVLFTGGGIMGDGIKTESQTAKEILIDFHVPLDRFLFEDKSKSTWENATLSYAMMHPSPQDTWILITSAVHMPRAVENFRRVGWRVTPYCVDYKSMPQVTWQPFQIHKNMTAWTNAMREFASLTRDYLLGRSKVLVAAP